MTYKPGDVLWYAHKPEKPPKRVIVQHRELASSLLPANTYYVKGKGGKFVARHTQLFRSEEEATLVLNTKGVT